MQGCDSIRCLFITDFRILPIFMTCDLVNVWPITRTDLFLLRSSSRCPRIQRAPRMRAPPFKCIVVCLSKPWLTHHSSAGFNSSASLTLACRAWVPSPHIITQSRHSCLVLLGCSSGQLITGITTNVSGSTRAP